MHEVSDVGDDAMTLPEVEVAGCFSDDGSPGEGSLGLEQLFAVTQLELEEIQDMIMLEKEEETTSLGPEVIPTWRPSH
jgi:hypothetical protein